MPFVTHHPSITAQTAPSPPSGGIKRNFSLTITNVNSADLGNYKCVAINAGGVSEKEVQLTFDSPLTPFPGLPFDEKQLTIIIGVASGALFILIIILIVLCCCCRWVKCTLRRFI